MAGHSVGMMSDFTSYPKLMRRMQARLWARRGEEVGQRDGLDEMTAMQVADNAELTTDQLIAKGAPPGGPEGRPVAGEAAGAVPPHADEAGHRRLPQDRESRGRCSYLLDVIHTRDPWTHRVDIARATGRDLVLIPSTTGASSPTRSPTGRPGHGVPVCPRPHRAGRGQFHAGHEVLARVQDAVEFCRTLSGRATGGTGLLGQPVPF